MRNSSANIGIYSKEFVASGSNAEPDLQLTKEYWNGTWQDSAHH